MQRPQPQRLQNLVRLLTRIGKLNDHDIRSSLIADTEWPKLFLFCLSRIWKIAPFGLV
jgi:hypothetical protein